MSVNRDKLNLLTKSSACFKFYACQLRNLFCFFSYGSVLGSSSRVRCHGGLRDEPREGLRSMLVL